MRKVVIFLIIIISFIPFLTKKSDYKDITDIIYVSSIGLDYDEDMDEYTIYFYIINNFNLGNSQIASGNTENLSYVIKVSDHNFISAFNAILKKTNMNIYFTHLQTMIISKSFFNNKAILNFYNYIRDFNFMYYNFYLFTTDSKIQDLYNIQNFSDVSAYHTLIVSPNLVKSYKLITFVDFSKAILDKNYTLLIPHISSIVDAFIEQDKSYYYLEMDGYSILQNDFTIKTLLYKDYSIIKWLIHLSDQHFQINIYDIYIKSGRYSIHKKQDKFIITYTMSAILNLNPNSEALIEIEKKLIKFIEEEITNQYRELKKQNIDIFNIKYKLNNDYFRNDNFQVKIKLYLN